MDCGKAKARVPRDSIESTSARLPEQQTAVTGHELVLHTVGQQIEEDTEEDVLEFDLEDEVDHGKEKFLAMARYYSGKKFNARGMLEEIRVAWGLHSMKPARILGDNGFMLEFDSYEARRRVVNGGPWRNRGMPCWWWSMMGFTTVFTRCKLHWCLGVFR
jgi:hypothetical protein